MARANRLPTGERRAAIIAATEPLLVELGRSVSTKQIAAAAGVAEGTLFRVFANKDELIDAVIEDAFDVAPTLAELQQIDRRLDLEPRLEAAVAILTARVRRVISLFGALRRPPGSPCPPNQPDPGQTRQPASSGAGNPGGSRGTTNPDTPSGADDQTRAHAEHEARRRENNARVTAAVSEVIGPDATRLRVPPEQTAELIRGLVFTATHPIIGATFAADPKFIVDTLLHGVLIRQEAHQC